VGRGRRFSAALLLVLAALLPPAALADLTLDVYVRDGCPHCADAKDFLTLLARERPDLRIVYRSVDRDPAARAELERLTRAAQAWPPGVPTFVAGGRVMIGFEDAATSGPALRSLLDGAAPAPAAGSCEISAPSCDAAPAGEVDSAWLGHLSASEMGLPLFTLALGLLDGFNPCAMWVLLLLLSLLVNVQDRRRMALVAGTFVAASGVVYYAFMAAWLNVFLLVGLSDAVRWTLAAVAAVIGLVNVKDFVAFGRGVSFSIPDAAKPGIYARLRGILHAQALPATLAGTVVLAFLVNLVELLCTAGLPAIYTAVLTQHAVSPAAHYAYLGLYILAYIADDALMVTIAVVTLSQRKVTERAGRALKLVSGAVMLILAAILLARPEWLA